MNVEQYNKKKAGDLWQISELPTQFRDHWKNGAAFARRVRVFQSRNGLKVDGKLGPLTLRSICLAQLVQSFTAPVEVPTGVDASQADRSTTSAHIVINGERVACPFDVVQHDYLKSRKRRANTLVTKLIVHQSCTTSLEGCIKVLRGKGYGVHLAIDFDGSVHQLGDLSEAMAHANEVNNCAVGVELIGPYYKTHGPWQEMIDPSPVAHKKREVSDTPAQIDALDMVCAFLCAPNHNWICDDGTTINIPLELPTTSADKPTRGTKDGSWFDPDCGGIFAHGHRPAKRDGVRVKGGHADARRSLWLLLNKMQGAA